MPEEMPDDDIIIRDEEISKLEQSSTGMLLFVQYNAKSLPSGIVSTLPFFFILKINEHQIPACKD